MKKNSFSYKDSHIHFSGKYAGKEAVKNALLSNFWGDVDNRNFYQRSEDYIQLANRERQG